MRTDINLNNSAQRWRSMLFVICKHTLSRLFRICVRRNDTERTASVIELFAAGALEARGALFPENRLTSFIAISKFLFDEITL